MNKQSLINIPFSDLAYLVLIVWAILWLGGCASQNVSTRDRPVRIVTDLPDDKEQFKVLDQLADALRTNNHEAARAVVTEDQWVAIDEWVKTHEAIPCTSAFRPESTSVTGSPFDDTMWSGSFSSYGLCTINESTTFLYSLFFEQITLQKIEGIWKVTEWQGLEETFD